jgi:4-amino-4-deoxy-L-arabinose transferase-like glycosyltransferase
MNTPREQFGDAKSLRRCAIIFPMAQSASRDAMILSALGLATVVLHAWTGGRYGFHRDELATFDDARHLAWGFVAYPPLTPFFGRLSLLLFGTSLAGFRFFAALAEAVALMLTGLMARSLGGGRGGQLVAAAAALPVCLAGGSLMQYVSFDYLFWVLASWCVVRMLESEDPRWWAGIGASMGLGMMAKYSMVFFAVGLGAGLLLTPARKYLAGKWLWCGIAIALAIVSPNLIWQARHSFVSLDFLRFIHARDIRIGRTTDFLPDQLKVTLLASLLAAAGLYFYLLSRAGRRYRALGWMYAALLLLFVIAKGRGYYLAAAYPMLYAGGAVWGEQRLASIGRGWAGAIRAIAWTALALDVLIAAAFTLPMAPVDSPWGKWALQHNEGFREEIGWQELVQTIAEIHRSVPQAAILAENYGEAGAVDLYGPRYGLPQAISGVNSFWERGYGNPPPEVVIVIGATRDSVDGSFTSCELAGHNGNRYGVENEESRDHPDIFVCRGLRPSWPEFWRKLLNFG